MPRTPACRGRPPRRAPYLHPPSSPELVFFADCQNQRFRKGVGGRGLATNKAPKRAQKALQKCVPILLRGHRKKGTEKRPKSLAFEGFLRANPLCPPTPFRNFCQETKKKFLTWSDPRRRTPRIGNLPPAREAPLFAFS